MNSAKSFVRLFSIKSPELARQQLANNSLRNNFSERKLEVRFNGHSAYVEYEPQGKVMILNNTYVPEEFQNYGLGHILAERVFNYVIANNLKMKIHCEFLASMINKNEGKYSKYVVE